eukprot:COSAG02_NODE_60318_length_271_cov_1.209302_1_plen_39_part_10
MHDAGLRFFFMRWPPESIESTAGGQRMIASTVAVGTSQA